MTITKVRRERVTLPAAGFSAPCPVCQRDVEILNCSQAAAILEVAEEALQALLASGVIHGIRTVSGIQGICRNSLFQPDDLGAERIELGARGKALRAH